jgi:selenocysteine lyase/cysteine desulfurase
VSFEINGADLDALRRKAIAEGVTLSCREGRLRISPHAYNDAADIERLVAVIANAGATKRK